MPLVYRPPKSTGDTVYEQLLDRLLTRELPAGEMLSERRIAEALGVSRTPLREALRRLEGEGLITRSLNRVMVRSVSITDFIHALDIRRLLEAEASAKAAGRLPGARIEELRDGIRRLLADPDPSPAEHWSLDDAVHEAIARANGNDVLAQVIRGLRQRTRLFNLRRMPDRLRPGCVEHLAILDAIAAGQAEAAREAMVEHLENVKRSIMHKLAEP